MYNHVLIPVAPDHIGAYGQAMAVTRKLLGSGGKISVLTVLEEVPAYVALPSDLVEKNIAAVSSELKAEFEADDTRTHVITGHSANSILDWAEKHDVDCIILSSHRPGLSDYFIGSTAARVVRHATCSVHVLR